MPDAKINVRYTCFTRRKRHILERKTFLSYDCRSVHKPSLVFPPKALSSHTTQLHPWTPSRAPPRHRRPPQHNVRLQALPLRHRPLPPPRSPPSSAFPPPPPQAAPLPQLLLLRRRRRSRRARGLAGAPPPPPPVARVGELRRPPQGQGIPRRAVASGRRERRGSRWEGARRRRRGRRAVQGSRFVEGSLPQLRARQIRRFQVRRRGPWPICSSLVMFVGGFFLGSFGEVGVVIFSVWRSFK